MAAAILTLVLTFIVSGVAWLSIGNLFRLDNSARRNDVLNLGAYAMVVLPVVFAIVFFAMSRF